MKCPNCGAESKSDYCEYCGSEIPKQQQNVNITNNYYNHTTNNSNNNSTNKTCPNCGSNNIQMKRESAGRTTYTTSRKKVVGKGRKSRSVSYSSHRVIGFCKDCGYEWSPNSSQKSKKTWLWVLGWLCIFPVPLTILMLRNKEMKPALKYGIIAIAWIVYLLIGLTSNANNSNSSDSNLSNVNSTSTSCVDVCTEFSL